MRVRPGKINIKETPSPSRLPFRLCHFRRRISSPKSDQDGFGPSALSPKSGASKVVSFVAIFFFFILEKLSMYGMYRDPVMQIQEITGRQQRLINIDKFYEIGGVPGSSAGVLFKCTAATAKIREASKNKPAFTTICRFKL